MNDETIIFVKFGLGSSIRSKVHRFLSKNESEKIGVAYKLKNGIQGIPLLDIVQYLDLGFHEKITTEKRALLEDNLYLLKLLKGHREIITGNDEAISRIETMIKRTVEELNKIKEGDATRK
ncbi:MAG: hypothetical protein ACFFCS_27505 [Candidatus Hodarchaeota archaeon]